MTTSAASRRSFLKGTAAISAAALAVACAPSGVRAAGNDKIKVGLVGCGGRGRGAAINCLDADKGTELYAMADLFADQMELAKQGFAAKEANPENAGKYKGRFTFQDRCFVGWDAYKKLLATDVDYVILATPPGFRPMMIKAAIEAGKHVFAEKPCAVDPAGVQLVLEAAEMAAKKNLGIVSGTQRRHQPSYVENVKRIQAGDIGKIIAAQVYWTQGEAEFKARNPAWSEMEYHIRNWQYHVWLAGDHIVEQHMHQMDVMNWIMGGPPKLCIGVGGRQVRTGPEFGNIYDHFAIDYEYANGARVTSICRQTANTYGRVQEHVQGTDGDAIVDSIIRGKNAFKFELPEGVNINPYEQEHADLCKSIRDGKPLNEGKQTAESTLTAIMGRMSAYTGSLVTWAFASKSKFSLWPAQLEFNVTPPPDKVAMPGEHKLEMYKTA